MWIKYYIPLVIKIRGTCANIPKKAWKETVPIGMEITNSWRAAETANTINEDTDLDNPRFVSG